MSKFKEMSKGWQTTSIIFIVLFAVLVTICVIAAIKSGIDNIGFFEAMGQLFGATKETAGEVVDDVLENPDVVEDAVEAALSLI